MERRVENGWAMQQRPEGVSQALSLLLFAEQ